VAEIDDITSDDRLCCNRVFAAVQNHIDPALPITAYRERCERDARDETGKAARAFLTAWDDAESNRGCYSCCDEHDCRCRTRYAKPEPCNCGRAELAETSEALRLALDPDGRLAGPEKGGRDE
jgi:hypothetical protein